MNEAAVDRLKVQTGRAHDALQVNNEHIENHAGTIQNYLKVKR